MQYLTLRCICSGQDLKRTDKTIIVAGQVAKAIIVFGFASTEWADMTIYARFQDGSDNTVYDVLMNDEYEVEIPHEVTDHPGRFNVALRAENSDHRIITSDIETFRVIPTIEGEGSTPSEPTETIFQKLMAAADKANAAAESATQAENETRKGETSRVAAESQRATAETSRSEAESTRKTAETTRVESEKTRVAAEKIRVESEKTRNQNETTRKASEKSRTDAEKVRETNESKRVADESIRTKAESTRVSNESNRETAEEARSESEKTRNQNESTRETNEEARVAAEVSRVESEADRVAAENARATSEQTREKAESARVESTSEAVKNAETATTKANEAAKRAEDAADSIKELYPVYNPETGKYDNATIRKWLASKRTGKRYGIKQLKSNVVECEKLWDNAGIDAPIPGKIGTPAVDPYVKEGGPFLKYEVNGGVESDSTLYVAKFQDEDGFNRAHPTHDTCILTPVIWIKHAEFSDSVIDGISDMWHPGWYPCPAALREDGTLQPFMLWAKYPLSRDANGKPRSTSNAKPLTRTVSHNSLITICDYAHSGGGSKTCGDDWYLKIMIFMKYGTKDSQKFFAGTTAHAEQVRPTIEENGVKRVIIATSEANKFPIGSAMMFGTNTSGNNDRGNATSYDIFDDIRITKIEKYDDNNSAVYFDTEETFDTKTTYLLSTSHWWCGACDEVEGDGSPYNPKSGREPYTVQGIEVAHGFYEIIGNMILKSVGSGWKIYVNYNSLNEATSVTSNYTDIGYTYPAHTTDGWIYPQYVDLTLGVMITKGIGASTGSGVCDGTWLYKDTTTGEMEWLSLGYLWDWSNGGVSCVGGSGWLVYAWWVIGGRRSYMSRSLVPTKENLKKAA